MSETIPDSDGEYTEATRYDVMKQLEWNVLESPVFKFKSHGQKFAFQFTLTDTEKMRSVFAEKGYIADVQFFPFSVSLDCLKAPSNCCLRFVNICCGKYLEHEILRFDLNNLRCCPIVNPGAAKFPLSCDQCERSKYERQDVSVARPHSYSVNFELFIGDSLVVHSEEWTFASPWIELSNVLRLRAYLAGEYDDQHYTTGKDLVRMNMGLELEYQRQRFNSVDFLQGFSICVTGFDRKIQGQLNRIISDNLYQSNSTGYIMCMWPVSLPVSPNANSLKIVVGSSSFKQPILYSVYEVHKMFIAVVSKTEGHSDCTLRAADAIFPTHKAVLDVFPYFKGKFNVDGSEKPSIDLPSEMLPESTIELIRFLYLRKVENLDSLAEDLIKVASELMLDELKQICANALQSKLSVENVLSLLVMADKMQCVGLKDSARLFLHKHVNEVRQHSEEKWKEFLRSNEGLSYSLAVEFFDASV